MKKILIAILLFLSVQNVFSQTNLRDEKIKNVNPNPNGDPWIVGGLRDLNSDDWQKIEKTPKLILNNKPKGFIDEVFSRLKRKLVGHDVLGPSEGPERVDNSLSKAFRPIFSQDGNCCAQASGVSYNFTYEVNLLNNTDASKKRNCFPSHYTWNLLNGGKNNGSWYYDGWNMIMANGCPKIPTFGSMDCDGDFTFWMSGYEKYHKAMKNRVVSVKTIDLKTWKGINTLRGWLFDKGRGDKNGGLANFGAYASDYAETKITTGEHKGEKLITAWGPTGGHAMTIVGYDDSISYDYNNDGKCTNDIDINNDGKIDLRDSEQGAFIIANSWGTWWGNKGFSYMMYKLCAEQKNDGGLMARSVIHILDNVSDKVEINKTIDFKIDYDNRGQMMIGLAYTSDANVLEPDLYSTHFFNNLNKKGGKHDLRGDNKYSDLPMEMSLDVTNLHKWFPEYNGGGKFFFVINNYDGKGKLYDVCYNDITNNIKYKALINDNNISRGKYYVPINLFVENHVRLIPQATKLYESNNNNGSIDSFISFKVKDAAISKHKPVEGEDYIVEKLPLGLSIDFDASETGILKLSLLGKADAHEELNSSSVKIIFNDSMFSNLKSDDLGTYKQQINFDLVFEDKYSTSYYKLNDTSTKGKDIWSNICEILTVDYGVNFAEQAYVACEDNTSKIQLLKHNELIDVDKNWLAFNDVSSISEFTLENKYIGIKFNDNSGKQFYAWLFCKKDSKDELVISEFAYFNKADTPIFTGLPTEASIKIDTLCFKEDESTNYGSFSNHIDCQLYNVDLSLSKNSSLVEGLHYSITDLAQGLSVSVDITEDDVLQIKLKGHAVEHEEKDNCKFKISFKDELFQFYKADDITGTSLELDIKYRNAYVIIRNSDEFETIVCSKVDAWKTFNFKSIDGERIGYYMGFYLNYGTISVQAPGVDVLCNKGTSDISVFDSGDTIKLSDDTWFNTKRNNFPYLFKDSYKDWKGRDAYLGFALDIDGQKHLGWIHLSFSNVENSIKILNWAYNEQALVPIEAGGASVTVNNAPIADAGSNVFAKSGDNVTFDAKKSYDIDHADKLTYLWTCKSGIILENNTNPTLDFVSPNVTVKTEYVFELQVSDGKLTDTDTVVLIVDVNEIKENNPPVASAGDDIFVNEGDLVNLTALKSHDDDNDELIFYWSSDKSISLLNASSATPSFIAPMVDEDKEYVLLLTVSDGIDKSTAEVKVMVRNIPNNAPIAVAGEDISVLEGTKISLNGDSSSDVDANTKLSYLWSSDDNLVFENPNSIKTDLTAPMVDDDTNYVIKLTVSDGELSSVSSLTLKVENVKNNAPVAIIEKIESVQEESLVVLDASKSYDVDSEITYAWKSKDNVKLSNASQVKASFVAPSVDEDTYYEFELTVSDGEKNSTANIVIIVKNIPNNIPVAIVNEDFKVVEGDVVQLNGSKSYDSDPRENLSYLWTCDKNIIINDADKAIANFTAPQVESNQKYVFKLKVSDQKDSSEASVAIEIANIIVDDVELVANAGSDQTVDEEALVYLKGDDSSGLGEYGEDVVLWTSADGIEILDANTLKPSFVAPLVDVKTNFEFVLTIKNDKFESSSKVNVCVLNKNNIIEADFNVSMLDAYVGDLITFSNMSKSTDKISTFKWSFEGGVPDRSLVENPAGIVYSESGVYKVILTIVTENNETSKCEKIIKINAEKSIVEADFSSDKILVDEGSCVNYISTSKNVNDRCLFKWTFDGGTPNSFEGQNPPPVNYQKQGVFNVSLTIIDENDIFYKKESKNYISVDVVNSVSFIDNYQVFTFPNPASDHVRVNNAEGAFCNIYTVNGVFVKKIKISSNSFSIDVSSFPRGVYLLRILSKVINEKFKIVLI